MTRLPVLALTLGLSLTTSALAQSRPDVPRPAADAALGYLRSSAPARGLASADVADLVVSDGHTSERSGLTYVYVRQQLDGLDIVGTQVTVAVGRDGRVVHTAGDLVSGLASSADAAGSSRSTSLSAESALRAAAGHARIVLGTVETEAAAGGLDQKTRLLADGLSSPADARQVYVQTEDGALRRAWEVTLDDARSEHWWVIHVDATTGAELGRYDLTVSETFGDALPASLVPVAAGRPSLLDAEAVVGDAYAGGALVAGYKVFPMPYASPIYAPTAPPADGRSVVSGAEDATASPYGWHDTDGVAGTEFTTTRGNNTHTYIDRDDNEAPDAAYPSPDGGASLLFSFPIDFAQAPNLYTAASATNLFYWSNIIHDVTYRYGFTEAAGNFQANSYGRGGAGADAVDSEVQSGADNCNETNPCHNNANFSTPPDGSRPRMQMYDGTNVAPAVDGSLDAHVVVHEYGHGISNRLVGGPANVTCLQNSEQMGEGWSDWYGNMLTMRPGDTRTTRRPVGNYLFGQSTTGAGIRPAPYTTDFAVNNYTYQRTRSGLAIPHGIGFAWATILWEVTWDMIDAHGFNANLYNASGTAGNQMMLNLVTEGLKLTPCNPGFVSGRDAILAADAALYPDAANPGRGRHYATLWSAFARRGLGFSASQGLTSSNADNTEAFDTPLPSAVASIVSSPISVLRPAGGTATASVAISNTASAGAQSLAYSASLRNVTFVPAARPTVAAPPAEPSVSPSGEIVVHGGARSTAAKDVAQTSADAGDALAPALGTGGPDAFGYRWDDSNQPGGPVYAFTDISATGTAVTLGDDAASTAITLPFSFSYYGTAY
ncbi:MAG TPA: M36 family metallopeptidase, partial [Rubricoccaceae bacterium]